jgi:hypothetical protein
MSGQYIATAFQPPSIERVTIPAELHRELILNFVEGVAKSSDYIFTHVRIIKAADVARQGSDILMRIAAWLIERRAQWGDELKKTLSQAARIEFGSRCTERVFAAAYGQIYSRKRGRPPIQDDMTPVSSGQTEGLGLT